MLVIRVPHSVFINELLLFLSKLIMEKNEVKISDLDMCIDLKFHNVDILLHNEELIKLTNLIPIKTEILFPVQNTQSKLI